MALWKVMKGDKWRWLTCTNTKDERIKVPWPRGGGFDWEEIKEIELKCRCGKTVKLDNEKFLGKRRMRDCGCGGADREGDSSVITMTLPTKLKGRIRQYADVHESGNFSLAIANLVRAELDRMESALDTDKVLVDSQTA